MSISAIQNKVKKKTISKSDTTTKFNSKGQTTKILTKEEKKKLLERRKQNKKNADIAQQINSIYTVNISHASKISRQTKIEEILNNAKDKCYELCFRHDTCRSLQQVVKYGSNEHRQKLFAELKGKFIKLFLDKTAHFIVLKLSQYGTKEQKDDIIIEMRGSIRKISLNTYAAQVLDHLYMTCSKRSQYYILRELFDETFSLLYKTKIDTTLKEEIVKKLSTSIKTANINIPETPDNLLQNLQKVSEDPKKILNKISIYINRAIDKKQIMFRYLHDIIYQYLINSSIETENKRDIITSLCMNIPSLYHSKYGSLSAVYCISYGTTKDRKNIIKTISGKVIEFSLHEYAYIIILRMIDVIDDTVAITKSIIQPLINEALYNIEPTLTRLIKSKYGYRILMYLLAPHTKAIFSQDDLTLLTPPTVPNYILKKKIEKNDSNLVQDGNDIESKLNTISTTNIKYTEEELSPVCTYKKNPSLKVKELQPHIILPLLKSFLFTELEAKGQKGKQNKLTSNIDLKVSNNDGDDDNNIIIKDKTQKTKYEHLKNLSCDRFSRDVIYWTLINSFKYCKDKFDDIIIDDDNNSIKNIDIETSNDIYNTALEVINGLIEIVKDGEKEDDIIVCDLNAHYLYKKLAITNLLPKSIHTLFIKGLWDAIKDKLNIILLTNRGCFVLLSMINNDNQIKDKIVEYLKRYIIELKQEKTSIGYKNLYEYLFISDTKITNTNKKLKVDDINISSEKKNVTTNKIVDICNIDNKSLIKKVQNKSIVKSKKK